MIQSKGKEFEIRFKKDFLKSFSSAFIYRLNDQMTGYKYTSSNICDFICYVEPNLFLIECKTHKGASLPFKNITQLSKLESFLKIPGIRVGIILWLYEKDMVLYIPVSTISKMKEEGKKSVGLKAVEEGYNIKVIPVNKLKVFMRCDYSILTQLKDGE